MNSRPREEHFLLQRTQSPGCPEVGHSFSGLARDPHMLISFRDRIELCLIVKSSLDNPVVSVGEGEDVDNVEQSSRDIVRTLLICRAARN